jgi:hypothetical protein
VVSFISYKRFCSAVSLFLTGLRFLLDDLDSLEMKDQDVEIVEREDRTYIAVIQTLIRTSIVLKLKNQALALVEDTFG